MKIAYLKDYQEYMTALGKWSFEAWSKYNPQATRKNQIEKFKTHCHVDTLPLTLIALNKNDELIGMCSLRNSEGIRPELTPWLGSLYVRPTHRKQQVGEKLIEAIKNIAKNMGFNHLYLLTFETALLTYYRKLGWEFMGQDSLNDYPVSIMKITSHKKPIAKPDGRQE